MSKNLTEQKTLKDINSAFTACGFLIAHYIYITINQFCQFFNYKEDVGGALIYIALSALFFWLLKKAKESMSYSSLGLILMIYFGERVFSLTTFINESDYSAALIQLVICIPIIYFIITGVKSSIELTLLNSGKTKKKTKLETV